MRVIKKTALFYQCRICKTNYSKKEDAKKCEARTKEKNIFKKGNPVISKLQFFCSITGKYFYSSGKITQIKGLKPADEEYESKWLGGRRISWHVYEYVVNFRCICGRERSNMFYAPEIELTLKKAD